MRTRITFLLVFLMMCSGCGTICSHQSRGKMAQGGVYQGVRLNSRILSHSDIGFDPKDYDEPGFVGISICFAVWDMPLSAVADTLIFPVDYLK